MEIRWSLVLGVACLLAANRDNKIHFVRLLLAVKKWSVVRATSELQ